MPSGSSVSRFTGDPASSAAGVQADALERPQGSLRIHGEAAQALHLVAPELHPHRIALGGGKDVDEAAANGELTRVLDLVHPGVAEGRQFPDERLEVRPRTRSQS